MAFAVTYSGSEILGGAGVRLVWGTATNDAGDSGGDIATGLPYIIAAGITPTAEYGATLPKYTITTSSGTLTVVCNDGIDFNWWSLGKGHGA